MNHTKRYTTWRLRELDDIRKNGGINNCKIVEPAWLYTLNKKTGEITETEGTYWKCGLRSCFLVKDTDNFYENLSNEKIPRGGNIVWLSRQDKEQAVFAFGVYYQMKIAMLVKETEELGDILRRIYN